MTLIFVILVIYFVALILMRLTNVQLAYLFAPAIFLIVSWVYVFGLVGVLNLAMETLAFTAAGTLLYLLIRRREFQKLVQKNVLSASSLTFLLLSTISYFKTRDWMLSQWDEFSHWGTTVKAMHQFAVLAPASPAELWAAEYPPGLALFQYFVIDFNPRWSEGLLFWSLHLLAISMVIAALAECTLKAPAALIFNLFCALIATTAIFDPFSSIYADPILALTFGFSIFLAVKFSTLGNRSTILFAASVGFLSLIKETGIYFAAVAILINIVSTRITLKKKQHMKVSRYIPAVSASVTVFAIALTWRIFIYVNGKVNQNLTTTSIASQFSDPDNRDFNVEIAKEFFRAFFDQNLSPLNYNLLGMTGFRWTISCTLFFIIWATLSGRINSRRNLHIGLTLFFTTGIYLGLLIILYLTWFSENEARSLASFTRYVGAWYQGLFFAIVLLILSEFKFNLNDLSNAKNAEFALPNLKLQMGSFLAFVVMLSSLSSIYTYMEMIKSNQLRGKEVRVIYDPIKAKIKAAKIPDQSKVWIISQHSSGFDYYALRYEMINLKFGNAAWSIGKPYDASDIWTDNSMTAPKWANELRQYEYVILYATNESFNEEFADVFDSGIIESNSVYKVFSEPEKVILTKVE
jgi:hypothetical protein